MELINNKSKNTSLLNNLLLYNYRGVYMRKSSFIVGLVFTIILLNVCFVNAETNTSDFNASKAFEWLYNEMDDANWRKPTDTLAFSILALRNEGYDIRNGTEELKDAESNNHWDSISGSALATLALYKTGENVTDEIDWLLDQQMRALSDGNWLIQFLAEESGECRITYNSQTFEFDVNGTTVTTDDCILSDPHWVDFEECIKSNSADLKEDLDIDCYLVDIDPSILFRTFNYEYYIVDESRPFVIENGCFGSGGQCSCSETGFASWSLYTMNEHAYTTPYLRSTCHNVAGATFSYLLTGEGIEQLLDMQEPTDGSFDGDELKTGIAYLALKRGNAAAASKALDWLKWKQRRSDGSWDGDALTTAVVLYAAFSQDLPPGPGPSDGDEDRAICGNGRVEELEDCETTADCENATLICQNCECIPLSQTGCSAADECIDNDDCTAGKYCTSDCVCVDSDTPTGFCNSNIDCPIGEECDIISGNCVPEGTGPSGDGDVECRSDDECKDDEECDEASGLCVTKEKKGWLVWLIVAIIVIVAAVGGYFAYNQFFKGKFAKRKEFKPFPAKPKYPTTPQRVPVSRPRPAPVGRARPTRSRVEVDLEKQLDESLKKAREMLKKKK